LPTAQPLIGLLAGMMTGDNPSSGKIKKKVRISNRDERQHRTALATYGDAFASGALANAP
jgi:hypothetical protein